MATDADGNYYYDAGTVNEQMDNVDVIEDEDGYLSISVGGSEVRVHNLAFLFGGQRAHPGTDELSESDNEMMMFVSDGTATNVDAGDLAVARNPDGTIETAPVVEVADFADV